MEILGIALFVIAVAIASCCFGYIHGRHSKTDHVTDIYQYRNLPCNCVQECSLWCVTGYDGVSNGGGVLEWARSEDDAKIMLEDMKQYSQFSNLSVEHYHTMMKKRRES